MPLTIQPAPGTDIRDAYAQALAVAVTRDRPVSFDFNGEHCTARPGDDAQDLADRWLAKAEADATAYRASPKGMAAEARAEAERARGQALVDRLAANLPVVLARGDDRGLLAWLAAFTDAADHRGVRCDFAAILARLGRAGYQANMHVGESPDSFGDLRKLAEYIVGQTMNFMAKGFSPHPMTAAWARRALRGGEATDVRAGRE